MGFFEFWEKLFFRPKDFFVRNIGTYGYRPGYFPLALIIFGIGSGIDRVEAQFIKYDLRGKLDDISFLNNWLSYWLFAVVGGMIGGYIAYLIGGWFFNVRLRWSKGTGDLDKSRYIYLYSGVVVNLIIIVASLISTLTADKPYSAESETDLTDIFSALLLLFFLYYSVYVSYMGVRSITDADAGRSKVWFLVLPIVLYSIAYVSVIALIVNYSLNGVAE